MLQVPLPTFEFLNPTPTVSTDHSRAGSQTSHTSLNTKIANAERTSESSLYKQARKMDTVAGTRPQNSSGKLVNTYDTATAADHVSKKQFDSHILTQVAKTGGYKSALALLLVWGRS